MRDRRSTYERAKRSGIKIETGPRTENGNNSVPSLLCLTIIYILEIIMYELAKYRRFEYLTFKEKVKATRYNIADVYVRIAN